MPAADYCCSPMWANGIGVSTVAFTMGVTTLYAGQYDAVADPDYFLVFSEFWRGNQFAIPQDRITNIGWAYKNIINKLPMKEVVHENTCLVISSPEISSKLVETVLLFGSWVLSV